MKTYESMKPSNVLWLGSIPEHWTMRRNITLLTERDERSEQGEEQLLSLSQYTGITIRGKNSTKMGMHEAESLVGYKVVHENDIVMNIMLAWNGSTAKSKFEGIISPAYAVYHLIDDSANPDYLHYLYKTPYFMQYFEAYSTGLIKSRLRLYPQSFLHLSSIVPPREEQDQIVRFLDWKVSEINRLINIKRKEIAVLKEQLAVYVSKIIVTGVSDNPSMKPCDIEWIGAIPEHWETLRCKYLFSERDERSVEGKETHLSMSQKYGLIPDDQLGERRMLSESYAGAKICYKNDLVLNRLKAHLGVFALAPQLGVISPDYTVLMPNINHILPEFAEMVLKSQRCRRELRIRVRGVTEGFWRLYTDDFNTITIPVPPLEEQKKIMEAVSSYMDKMKQYESCLTKEIEVLHEFKTRLISDVVTGKIDVRGIEIPEYEYTAEEADNDSEAEAEELDEEEE